MVCSSLPLAGLAADPVVITSNLTISETDTTYDGADLVINGAITVSINGAHSFNSLTSTNSATLTHSPCTATETHRLDLTVANSLVVTANSKIDVSGKGYVGGRTTGNTAVGAAFGPGGGSHGGPGGHYNNIQAAPYGDYTDPDDWGGGSGSLSNVAGGGLVRIVAGQMVLDGQVLADGATAGSPNRSGGAGGGVYLEVGVLRGNGLIRAMGGGPNREDQGYAAGGGGRIAVYAQDYTAFDLAAITAPGGIALEPGGPGTVYLSSKSPRTHARFTVPGRNLVFPTNSYRDHIPVTLTDGLAVRFNRAILTNSLSPDGLLIEGPLGAILPSRVSEIGDRLYRFDFPPQTEQGAYRFTLLPTLLDAEGFPLDQDADGIPGEPEDAFQFTLVLDTIPPHITQHSPAGDVAGTLSEADLWFSETIDTNTFTPGDITLFNPTNGVVNVSSIRSVGLNRFRFTFPPQTRLGQYRVRVGPNIADLAGNLLDQDGDGVQGEDPGDRYDFVINLVQVDLQLAGVTPSASEYWAGETASVSWTGHNATGAPLLGNWLDAVYLSSDPFWGFTDIRLATVQHTGGLAENEVYTSTATFQVPGALPGNYHLVVRANIGNQTRETVEANNAAASEPVTVKMRELLVGGTATGTLTPADRLRYSAVNVLPGESLRLRLTASTGVNHLLVNLGDSTPP